MFASPNDVTREREYARDVVHEWNVVHAATRRLVLLPIGWETHATPTIGTAPQQVINREVLQKADLLVGIFWTRLGTQTATHASGTVEELERHIAAGKPALLYFSDQPANLSSLDTGEYQRLQQFKEQMRQRGLVETYATSEDFRERFYRHLQLKLNDAGYFTGFSIAAENTGSLGVSSQVDRYRSATSRLSSEAVRLLRAASGDQHGYITRTADIGGVIIYSNKETLFDHGDARSLAAWDAALAELQNQGLIELVDRQYGLYRITHNGYNAIEQIA